MEGKITEFLNTQNYDNRWWKTSFSYFSKFACKFLSFTNFFKTTFTTSCCSSCFHFRPALFQKKKTTSRLNEEQLSAKKFNNCSSRASFRLNQLVDGRGPPKTTFRYHSRGVMLTHIFGKANYSRFILCMIAMLNEQLNRIYHVTK